MADDKGSSQHADEVKPEKKRGCAAHCRRFWWIYLLASIAVILLVVLLIIFVAIPKIAQKKLDDAELTVDSILISQTRPDSYQMSVNSTIRTDGKTHATVDAFTGSMYLEDSPDKAPFTTIDFPETTSEKESTVNVSQHVDIANMAGFTTFNTWLLNNETLRLTLVGDTHVRVKGISRKYGVTFRKTITLKGLNGFKGLNVTQASVNISAATDNFKGFVDIPNPSVLTIEIGNAQFHNYLNGQDIGTVYMDDLVLRPGINNVSIHADIKQTPVLLAVSARPNCETGLVAFQMGGKNVTDEDGGELTYFSTALASANQTVEINVGQALAAANVPVKCPTQ